MCRTGTRNQNKQGRKHGRKDPQSTMIKSLHTTACSHEAPFIRSALAQGLRLDGRRPHEPRDIDVALSRGEVTATASVTLGKTVVIAVVSAELVAPYPDRPTEGLIQFVADVSPLAEAHGVTSAELTRLLDRSVRESDAIDTGAAALSDSAFVCMCVCVWS